MTQQNPQDFTPADDWAYHPGERVQMNPLFAWPPQPVLAARWIGSMWVQLSSTLAIVLAAILTVQLTLPEPVQMKSLEFGWIATIWLRNIFWLVIFAGGLHWYFHQRKGQAGRKNSTVATLRPPTKCSCSTTRSTTICSGVW